MLFIPPEPHAGQGSGDRDSCPTQDTTGMEGGEPGPPRARQFTQICWGMFGSVGRGHKEDQGQREGIRMEEQMALEKGGQDFAWNSFH